jgi:hypothetical protein
MRCPVATISRMRGWVRAAFGSHLVKTSGLSVLSALLFAVPVAAGPWAQQEGSVFLSVTLNAEDTRSSVMSGRFDADPTMSVFGELGLGRSFTAGLELDWGTSSDMGTFFSTLHADGTGSANANRF